MTINSANRKAGPYEGTGSTGPYSFAFKVFQESDVLVATADDNGVENTLTLTTDYTVELNDNQDTNPGGTITLVEALATGHTMIISSQVPYTQQTELTNQGGFYPQVITNALDKLTIEIQQLLEKQGRQLTYPITDPSDVTGELPSSLDRASQYLAFDDGGSPIATLNIPDYIYQGVKTENPATRNSGSPLAEGDLYFNSSTNRLRLYTNDAWLNVATGDDIVVVTQSFNGNNASTDFTLTGELAYAKDIDVFISGVAQRYTNDFTVSGTTLSFTSAPPTGTGNIYVKYKALA